MKGCEVKSKSCRGFVLEWDRLVIDVIACTMRSTRRKSNVVYLVVVCYREA